jgi:hypothetical protein
MLSSFVLHWSSAFAGLCFVVNLTAIGVQLNAWSRNYANDIGKDSSVRRDFRSA